MADDDESLRAPDLTNVFHSLQSLVLDAASVESFLEQVAGLAAGIFRGRTSCGITLRRDGHPYTVASSDERARALDESQYADADGPCLHSLRTGETVWVPDLDCAQRWPEYSMRAAERGLRWSLSEPMLRSGADPSMSPLGALNVYGFDGVVPNAEQRRRCELFAAHAAGAVEMATSTIEAARSRRQLEAALTSRAVIDQAIGILMARQRCTAEEAFALLRLRSQHSNTRLRDVAAELIQRVTGHPPQPGQSFNETE